MAWAAVIGGAISIGGAVIKGAKAKKQARLANAIKPVDPSYERDNKLAAEGLAGARLDVNSRMAGAGAMSRNIKQAQANQSAIVTRNATSGAQVLAMSAASEGQAMQSAANLQTAEEQNTQGRKQRFNGMLIGQGDKGFNDNIRKYQQDQNAKDRLMGASMQNENDAIDGALSAAGSIAGTYAGEQAYTRELKKRNKLTKEVKKTNKLTKEVK